MVVLLPFSVYLAANPRTEWGWLLPGIPLVGAYAVQRGSSVLGWLSVAALTGIVLWLAVIFVGSPRAGRTWSMVVAPQETLNGNTCRVAHERDGLIERLCGHTILPARSG